jgi:hypothetical protein
MRSQENPVVGISYLAIEDRRYIDIDIDIDGGKQHMQAMCSVARMSGELLPCTNTTKKGITLFSWASDAVVIN